MSTSRLPVRPLWRDRNFAVFWAVQTTSALGDAFALVALPLLVLQATGSVAQMGLLTGVAGAGAIVTGLFAGMVVDRTDRRRLMIWCDVARAVLYGAIPVCWAIDPQVWLLYVVMAFASVFSMLFQVGYVTAVANLVDRDRIVEANSRLQTTDAVAHVAGPVLAGAVAASLGSTVAIALDAVSFAVSVAGLVSIRLRSRAVDPGEAPAWRDVRTSFVTGLRFLWASPVLRAVTILLTVITFLSLGLLDVFIYRVRTELGHGESAVGYLLGFAGAGTILGAALTARLRRRWGFGACWLTSYVVCGIAVAVLGVTGGLAVADGAALAYGAGMALAGICSMSLRQQLTPDHLLGRVTAAFWTLHSALGPIGAVVLTALVAQFGARGPLLAVGGVFLVVVVFGLFSPIRQRDPQPAEAPPDPSGPRTATSTDVR
ncbi:MFS transporter [Amycolatopsis sp. NPDC051716]|uniref:MFS transporter n=1 Tax=Amycolatopsis sp. NPDC051716 TaxID=3155804 RepID=UPI0034127748